MHTKRMTLFLWLAAAFWACVLVASGFQANSIKIGVVDFLQVVEQSDYYKTNDQQLKVMKDAREALLQFLDTYKVATTEQARRMRELAVKDALSDGEKQEYEKLKNDVLASDKKYKELSTKPPANADDTDQLREFARRRQAIDDMLPRWSQELERELHGKFAQVRSTAVDRARASVQEIGKAGGYTILFRADVAPYGANDVTDSTLKAMNAKK